MNTDVLIHAIEILDGKNASLESSREKLSSWDELRALANKPIEIKQDKTDVIIRTYADDVPSPAQIRAYTSYCKTGSGYEIVPDEKLDFIRSQSDLKGFCRLALPTDQQYLLVIDKGFAYSTAYEIVEARAGMRTEVDAKLQMLVDLHVKGVIAGDLHHHSIHSGPLFGGSEILSDTPEEVRAAMLATGLNYGALSDHNNISNHEKWRSLASNKFVPIISNEMSTSYGHVCNHGTTTNVVFEKPQEQTDANVRKEFERVTKEIQSQGGLAQLNHPYSPQAAISFHERFHDFIHIFDALEIWNGHHPPRLINTPNEKAFQLWISLLRKNVFLPAVAGSDTHRIDADDFHGMFEEINHMYDWLKDAHSSGTEISPSLKEAAALVASAKKRMIPMVERWVELYFGTGSVVNLTYLVEDAAEKNILASIKGGHNVITNGPILMPSVVLENAGGKRNIIPGNTVQSKDGQITVNIELYSKEQLDTIIIYTKGKTQHMDTQLQAADGQLLTYNTKIEVDVQSEDFVVVVVYGGKDLQAIANPIFVKD